MNTLLKIVLCLLIYVTPSYAIAVLDESDDRLEDTSVANSGTTSSFYTHFTLSSQPATDTRCYLGEIGSTDNKPNMALYYRDVSSTKYLYTEGKNATDTVWSAWRITQTLSNSTTYKIVLTWDNTQNPDQVEFYVNGTNTSGTNVGGTTNENRHTGTKELGIGENADGGQPSCDMEVHEFAYWTAELTSAEVSLLTDSNVKRFPLQIQPSSLQALYTFDDFATGTEVNTSSYKDISGNGNDISGVASGRGGSSLAETELSYP